MSTVQTQTDLYTAALALPESARAELAHKLIVSLGKSPGIWSIDDPGFEAELERRWQAYKSGEMPAYDWKEVVSRVRASLVEGRTT